jgi:hypothetical protein
LVSECYEEVCRQWIRERALELNEVSVGRQWSSAYEIDVAGVDANFQLSVVGECKWSENKIGLSVLRELEAKVLASKLPLAAGCRYVLFSKSGYAPDLEEVASESKNIVLESVWGVGKG